jgi:hypothetical protein
MQKYLCFLISLLMACQPAQQLTAALPEPIFRADFKAQQGGQIWVQIQPQTAGFQIKDSQSGAPRAMIADIQRFRVFLVNGSSGEPVGALTPAPDSSHVFTLPRSGGTRQTVLFDHVPPGLYYACMAAFKDMSNFTPATNISQPTVTSYAEGPVYCSNDGGEADFPGRVEVFANYQVSDTSRLLILPLQLAHEKPAQLHTEIEIQDGDGL